MIERGGSGGAFLPIDHEHHPARTLTALPGTGPHITTRDDPARSAHAQVYNRHSETTKPLQL